MKYRQLSLFIGLAVVMLLGHSCVSKKKYLEMEQGKIRAAGQVVALTSTVDSLSRLTRDIRSEFNKMQNELRLSNAEKDTKIDTLNAAIDQLSSNVARTNADMSDKMYAFEAEKRQLKAAIGQRDKQIDELNEELRSGEDRIKELNKELSDLRFDLSNQKDATTAKANQIEVVKNQLKETKARLKKAQSEIASMQSEMDKKDAELKKLRNNVKLLKSELAK
jgi:chromosome segregation ATPase